MIHRITSQTVLHIAFVVPVRTGIPVSLMIPVRVTILLVHLQNTVDGMQCTDANK